VDNHKLVVTAQMHVELNAVRTLLERILERGQRIFGPIAHRATVADDQRAAIVVQALS
jgi:hypothetical protein